MTYDLAVSRMFLARRKNYRNIIITSLNPKDILVMCYGCKKYYEWSELDYGTIHNKQPPMCKTCKRKPR